MDVRGDFVGCKADSSIPGRTTRSIGTPAARHSDRSTCRAVAATIVRANRKSTSVWRADGSRVARLGVRVAIGRAACRTRSLRPDEHVGLRALEQPPAAPRPPGREHLPERAPRPQAPNPGPQLPCSRNNLSSRRINFIGANLRSSTY